MNNEIAFCTPDADKKVSERWICRNRKQINRGDVSCLKIQEIS